MYATGYVSNVISGSYAGYPGDYAASCGTKSYTDFAPSGADYHLAYTVSFVTHPTDYATFKNLPKRNPNGYRARQRKAREIRGG